MNIKKILFTFLFILVLLPTKVVHAKNYSYTGKETTNGWYLVKNLTNPNKLDWAYYESGKETLRYSDLRTSHRGWDTAPENSLESFKLTKQNGFFGMETDIFFTKDNVAVLSHDATINRIARNSDGSTISETLYIKNLTLAELYQYDFVVTRTGSLLTEYFGNKITTLEEALSWAKQNGMMYQLELKEGSREQIESIIRLVEQYQMEESVVWLSFNSQLLEYVKDYNDTYYLGFNVNGQSSDELNNIYNSLKTSKNLVRVPGASESNPLYVQASNLPNNTINMDAFKLSVLVEEDTKTSNTGIEENNSDVSSTSETTIISVPSTGINLPLYIKVIGSFLILVGTLFLLKNTYKKG